MPEIEPTNHRGEEPVSFENWEHDGCHVFVDRKYVMTLSTPESSKCEEASRAFIEDWISPEEFCSRLTSVLAALGASSAVLAAVENERKHYRDFPVEPPARSNEDLVREVMLAYPVGKPAQT